MVEDTVFVYIVYKSIGAVCRFKSRHILPQIEDENKVSC